MSIPIDWSALLAPLIIKVIDAIVAAILKWMESQPAEDVVAFGSQLTLLLNDIGTAGDANKAVPVARLASWAKTIMAA